MANQISDGKMLVEAMCLIDADVLKSTDKKCSDLKFMNLTIKLYLAPRA